MPSTRIADHFHFKTAILRSFYDIFISHLLTHSSSVPLHSSSYIVLWHDELCPPVGRAPHLQYESLLQCFKNELHSSFTKILTKIYTKYGSTQSHKK